MTLGKKFAIFVGLCTIAGLYSMGQNTQHATSANNSSKPNTAEVQGVNVEEEESTPEVTSSDTGTVDAPETPAQTPPTETVELAPSNPTPTPRPAPAPDPAPTSPPVQPPTDEQPTGVRIGAICRDGTRSTATGRGACSHHRGVAQWLYN